MTRSRKTRNVTFVCGPVPGGRGYLDFCEHAEQKRKRKACDPGCFFCEADRHPERYECVNGEWVDRPGPTA